MNTPYDPEKCRAIPVEWKSSSGIITHTIHFKAPFLVGIAGRKRAGKDTVASMLMEHPEFAGKMERIGFADALKKELSEATGFPVEFIEDRKDDFRLGLQWWGTELRRGLCGENYWIDKLKEQVLDSNLPFVVVPDVRFPNELALIKELGGMTVRVYRSSDKHTIDLHPSETALDSHEFDWVIHNDADFNNLRQKVSVLALNICQKNKY